ncbi:hypothetical protein LTR53_016984 [Teratosphaeriaceae sp. CCFEE 6253]|nr:hypothetical protein LTR53_016984 [Teratosphaeriaceae sp. CCFEE 6253]
MAKDKTEDPSLAKKEKKDKKDKKRKHSEVEPETAVAEEATPIEAPAKKEKKSKKDRKSKTAAELAAPKDVDADGDVAIADATPVEVKDEEDEEKKEKTKVSMPLAALVPFANPLCDEKSQKKVLKGVKKAAKSKALKRGVKECVKAIRKSPPHSATATSTALPLGIVILAADISPMDVISHIPVLCEDHGMPYLYVPSRAELGAAGNTKRPTSVVMLSPKAGKGVEGEGGAEWETTFGELNKLAVKLGQAVKV